MFSNAEEELGGPAGFVRCGYMVIAPEGQEDALRKVVPLQKSFGVETELLRCRHLGERLVEGLGLVHPGRTLELREEPDLHAIPASEA